MTFKPSGRGPQSNLSLRQREQTGRLSSEQVISARPSHQLLTWLIHTAFQVAGTAGRATFGARTSDHRWKTTASNLPPWKASLGER